MKLIVGLGNPEKRFEGTRHNTGFFTVDTLADNYGITWQHKDRFRAFIAELPDKSAILVKPTTYYNLVGESIRALADFYKISPEDILIVHDELALPFGVLRTREKGSDAGNNGIKSINLHLGTLTKRLRIGISNELAEQIDAADFVLGKFTSDEKKQLRETVLPHIEEHIHKFLTDTFEPTRVKTLHPLETPEA